MKLAGSIAALVALASAAGCPSDPRDELARERVAVVGETSIHRLEFLRELTWAGVARTADKEARVKIARELLDRMIVNTLLLAAAEREGITVPAEDVARAVARSSDGYPAGTFDRVLGAEQMTIEGYAARVARQLTIDAYLTRHVKAPAEPGEAELRARHLASSQGPRPAAVRVRQVLVKTEEEATHILEEVRARRLSLEEAARRYSAAPEREEGGLLPWFSMGELPPVFDLCFSLQPGQVSDVVASTYGFHIFEVVAARAAGPEPFDEARPRLTAEIRRDHERQSADELIEGLRGNATISIDEVALLQTVARLPSTPEPTEKGPDPLPGDAMPAAGDAPPPLTGEPPAEGATP